MSNKYFRKLHNYFSFSRKERAGFYFLSALLLLIISAPLIVDKAMPGQGLVHPEDRRVLDSLVSIIEKENANIFFQFDPNSITRDSLVLLGISRKVADRWVKYRNAGGVFYKPDDIKKIYGMDSVMAMQLLEYVILKDIKPIGPEHQYFTTSVKESVVFDKPSPPITYRKIDINKATKEELVEVNGIGEVLSTRIIKYRDLLGGFINADQYKSVYGLPIECVDRLKEKFYIDSLFTPARININSSEYKEILRHPYISKEITDKLFEVRNRQDYIFTEQNFKQLVNHDSTFNILFPYIEF